MPSQGVVASLDASAESLGVEAGVQRAAACNCDRPVARHPVFAEAQRARHVRRAERSRAVETGPEDVAVAAPERVRQRPVRRPAGKRKAQHRFRRDVVVRAGRKRSRPGRRIVRNRSRSRAAQLLRAAKAGAPTQSSAVRNEEFAGAAEGFLVRTEATAD